MVKVPNNPATPYPIVGHGLVSLGTVNVTDYRDYVVKDAETVNTFVAKGTGLTAASLETTHGLLRVLGPSAFVFVSGITDRLGHFDDEVNKGQNFAASFNAGLMVSGLITRLNAVL